MLLRLYPPLLAALMIALAAAVPGAFWLHARSARRRAPRMAPSAAIGHDRAAVPRPVPPTVATTPPPSRRSFEAVRFRARRVEERVWSPEPDSPPPPRTRPRG